LGRGEKREEREKKGWERKGEGEGGRKGNGEGYSW